MANTIFAEASIIANGIIASSWLPYFHARYRRIVFLLCTPFILAFVTSNLLDLDGFNLASLNRYAEPYILFGEPETEFRIKPLTERLQYLGNSFNLMGQRSRGLISSQNHAPQAPSLLEKARSHLYHVSLPRDSGPG